MKTAITKDSPVLVTGATGYFAGVLIKDLLEEGLTVHGTVRDIEDTDSYQHILDLPGANSRFKVFAADLLKAGTFKNAMEGCKVVFHTATPRPEKIKDPYKEVVAPCIKGTKNVLNQAKKTPSVKRIVLTSSINAMYSDAKDILDSEEKILNESFWNETASMDYEPYFFGKTLAEKDAWEKMEKQDQWDLVTICPGLILGPGVKCHRKAHSVSLITSMGNGTYKWGILELAVVCVDVRDVSRAHIEAAFRPEANGRYIVALQDEPTNYFAISQMLRAVHPEFEGGPQWPEAPNSKNIAWTFGPLYALHRRFISRNVGYPVVVDASRSESELNLRYRPLSETLRDMAKQIIDEGLWNKEHMAEEARLAKEEEKRLKELEKEERLKRRELRLAKEAEEREKAKQERAAEKERLREEKKRAKEERERERLGHTNNAEPNSNEFARDNSVSNMV